MTDGASDRLKDPIRALISILVEDEGFAPELVGVALIAFGALMIRHAPDRGFALKILEMTRQHIEELETDERTLQ